MEPVIGGLIGWILTDESFIGPFTIVGGSLMIAGAIMVTLEENEEHHG